MANRKGKTGSVDDLLFKPLIAKTYDPNKVVMVFNCDTHINQSINGVGKKTIEVVNQIDIIDITSTASTGYPVTDTTLVTDSKVFRENVVEVSAAEHIKELVAAANVILTHMMAISDNLKDLAKILTSMKYAAKMSASKDGNPDASGDLVIGTPNGGVARIVFKTVTGQVAKLSNDDVQHIGGVIMETIFSHVNMDTKDKLQVKKLKDEIEYKLVDALPNNMKADDIHVDIDAVIDEIDKFQQYREETVDDDEDDSDEEDESDDQQDTI